MGVTLERVQFKFASIIGELCSEPDILSQFAVWVDLRLAEYKLKGSISLDCSGDTPEPVWLQGILSALLAKKLAKQRAVPKPSGHSYGRSSDNFSQGYKSHRPRAAIQLEDTPVNVKEEVYDDGVYPVGPPSQNISDRNRKRSATVSENNADQADILYSHSTPKQRRPENNGNPSTESLMSIIGDGEQVENSSALQYDSLNDTLNNTGDAMINSDDAANTSQETGNMSDAQYGDQSSTSYDRGHTSSNLDAMASMGLGLRGLDTSGLPTMVKWPYHSNYLHYGLSGKAMDLSRRRSAVDSGGRKNTVQGGNDKNSRSSAKIFERWLQTKRKETNRSSIERIPPDELDPLLAEFLCNIKKTSGGDYDVVSFSNLRYNIDRYLTAKSYGFTITKSPVFPQCQAAFNKRRTQLRAKASKTNEGSSTANIRSSPKSENKCDSLTDSLQHTCTSLPLVISSETLFNSSPIYSQLPILHDLSQL